METQAKMYTFLPLLSYCVDLEKCCSKCLAMEDTIFVCDKSFIVKN